MDKTITEKKRVSYGGQIMTEIEYKAEIKRLEDYIQLCIWTMKVQEENMSRATKKIDKLARAYYTQKEV